MHQYPNRDLFPLSLEQLERMLENMKRSLRELMANQEMDQRWKELQIGLLLHLISKQEQEIRNRRRLQN